jgi:hypothetical protein
MNKKVFSQRKNLFCATAFAMAVMGAQPSIAGTVVNGNLVFVSAQIDFTATRPDGFYVILSAATDPGGLVLQGTSTPASCSNKWVLIPKDIAPGNDGKVYRDMVTSVQLAIVLKKPISVVSGACLQNYALTAGAPLSPYNYPIVYGIDIDWR